MKKLVIKIFLLCSPMLCNLAKVSSVFATDVCKTRWYQSKEPLGLAEFAKKQKKK